MTVLSKKHKDYPKQLAALIAGIRESLPANKEHPDYNFGTMEKDADISLSSNIAIANASKFKQAFDRYKRDFPSMPDMEAQARTVFDFLQQHNSNFSYEKNKDDILFDNTTREQFYALKIYNDALSSTNFFDRHIGDMQVLCLEPKSASDLPRNTQGLSPEKVAAFQNIPANDRLDIIYKRGLYHESIHMAMGTTDERKCDAFALLKIMKEYPQYAQAVFDVYNIQRSKIGHTLKNMHGKEPGSYNHQRAVKSGTVTYLMPNTYKKLQEYAVHPKDIPDSDSDMIKLACSLTAEPEFSSAQLVAFADLTAKENICRADLIRSEIVQSCMRQGNFTSVNDYINSDNTLKEFMDRQDSQRRSHNAATAGKLKNKIQNPDVVPAPQQSQNAERISPVMLKIYQNKKQND